MVNGLIGNNETNAASFSVKRKDRILYNVSEGGAPCGNLFNLSSRFLYAD